MTGTTEHRSLPAHEAGAIDVPFTIKGFDERIERDTHWEAHSHPTHELLWNEHGASYATVRSRTWTITPTVGLWMPAGVLHSAAAPAGTWYRTAQFGVRSVPSISNDPVAVQVTPLLRLLLERLADPRLPDASRAVTEATVLDVLTPSAHELLVQAPRAPLLAPIVAAVQRDPGDPRSLAAWAEQLGVSTRTITRAFRAETGLGFTRWVASVRAQHAVSLIVRGDEIEEIAGLVGYRSASAFGAAFRRATGLTPSAFRAR